METYGYRMDGFDEVTNAINQALDRPTSFPSIVYRLEGEMTPSSEQMRDNANLAYAYALKWARDDDSDDAAEAIRILNGWANNFLKIEICTNDSPYNECAGGIANGQEAKRLFASWVAPTFAAAAEIMKHYNSEWVEVYNEDFDVFIWEYQTGSGWESDGYNGFAQFLKKMNSDYIDWLVSGVIDYPSSGWANNNWGASAAYAQMAIAVYTNDRDLYDKGKHAITKNNGLIDNIISTSGEVNEMTRGGGDCDHPQYSSTASTYAADIDRIQGFNDIYGSHSTRLRDGWKGMAKTFDPNINFIVDCSDETIIAGVEKAANYWYNHSDIVTMRNRQAPYGLWWRGFYGFTTYTDYCTNTNFSPPC
jgi:hypothetical protein